MKKQNDWEKEFDKKWFLMNQFESGCYVTCGEEVKDFIRSLLTKEKEKLVKKIEGKEKAKVREEGWQNGYLQGKESNKDI